MRGPFGSIEPCHAMSNQESTRGADAKKLFVRSDFQAVGSATHEQKDIFDQEVTKAFFFVQHNLRTYGCFRKHLLQFLIISLILGHDFLVFLWFCQVHHGCWKLTAVVSINGAVTLLHSSPWRPWPWPLWWSARAPNTAARLGMGMGRKSPLFNMETLGKPSLERQDTPVDD